MPTYTMSMTQRSQVTVPAAVKRVLGLKPRDRVTFDITDGVVTVRPAAPSFASLAGSVPPFPGYDSSRIDEYIRDAKEDKAERDAEALSG